MFIPVSDNALNAVLAIPACDLIPTPTRETLAILESINKSSNSNDDFKPLITSVANDSSSFETVNVKSVFPLTLIF